MASESFRSSISFRYFTAFAAVFLLALAGIGAALEVSLRKVEGEHLRSVLMHSTHSLANMVETVATTSVKDNLRIVAHNELQITMQLYEQTHNGALTEEEAKRRAIAAMQGVSIGKQGYLYVINSRGELIYHPSDQARHLTGVDLPFVREQMRRKSGFLEYERPGNKLGPPQEKILFMVHFLPWDWIISATASKREFLDLVDIDDLRKGTLAHRIGPSGFSAVLTLSGEAVAHPWLEGNIASATDADGKAYINTVLSTPTGFQTVSLAPPPLPMPRTMLMYHLRLPTLNWVVMVAGLPSTFSLPLNHLRLAVLGATAGGLLAGLVLASLFASRMQGRMNTLVQLLKRGADGNYAVRAEVTSNDEFGTLASLFNVFLAKLQDAAEESARSQQLLEQRVIERTQELELREQEYRIIFESVSDGLLIVNEHGTVVEANTTAVTLFNTTQDTMRGIHLTELLHPDHVETVRNVMDNFAQGLDTFAAPFCRRFDNTEFECELRATTLDYGEQHYILLMVRDVTIQRKNERERRALARFPDENPNPILRVSSDGNILYSNSPACDALGTEGCLYTLPTELAEPTAQCLTDNAVIRKEIAIKRRYYAFVFAPVPEQHYVNIHGQDISARKHMEEALRLERERMALAFEASGAVIYEHTIPVDPETAFVDQKLPQLLGYESSHLPYEAAELDWWNERFAPDDRTRFLDEYSDFIQGVTQQLTTTIKFRHAAGRWIHLEIHAKAIGLDEYGRASRVVGVVMDVTHQRMVERSLGESEKWLRTIFNSLQAGIVVADIDTFSIVDANPVASDLIGLPRNELVGRDFSEFIQPGPGSLCISDGSSIRGLSGQGILVTAQGTEIPILGNEVVALLGGKRSIVHNFIDITALKQTERDLLTANAEMELLLSSISSILIGVDSKGAIRHWNTKATEVFNIPAADAIGRHLSDLALSWDQDVVMQSMDRCQTNSTALRIDEIHYTRADGVKRILGLSLHPIRSDGEGTRGCLLLGNDITDLMVMQHQSLQAQKLESIGQLAAGIAHEINTPTQYVGDNTRFLSDAYTDYTALIDLYGELLARLDAGEDTADLRQRVTEMIDDIDLDYLREEVPTAITQTIEGVERVSKIVRSMKNFAHPGAQEKVPVDIAAAIESTVTISRNEWKYVAELETDVPTDLPPLLCLPDEFNQVVLNMIINASHAIADKVGKDGTTKGLITISARRDGDDMEIRISDTGAGIPKSVQGRIFDPFFTTKDVGKGTGQGLNIAHSVIVEKHGGSISFTSEEGEGTTFILRLPLTPK